MLDSREVAATVRNRLAILVDVPADRIGDDTAFASLDVDSLMLLELVALIEQRVGFELPEQDLRALTTIGAVERYVAAVERDGKNVPK